MPDHSFVTEALSTWPIILHSWDSYYAKAFYDAFRNTIKRHCSPDYEMDILNTIRTYVDCQGNYKLAAERSNQHENTIRYRIVSLKKWLGMEHETIRFHETVSLAVKLEKLNDKKGERS